VKKKGLFFFLSVYTLTVLHRLLGEEKNSRAKLVCNRKIVSLLIHSPQYTCSYHPIRNKLEQPKKAKHSWDCLFIYRLQLQMEPITTHFLS